MNPVFWVLIILAIVGLWFILAPIFRGIGKIILKIFKRAKDEIEIKESEDYFE